MRPRCSTTTQVASANILSCALTQPARSWAVSSTGLGPTAGLNRPSSHASLSLPIKVQLSEYLLEKSRVVSQAKGEGNYHIFSFLQLGLPPQRLQELGLRSPDQHAYTAAQSANVQATTERGYHQRMMGLVCLRRGGAHPLLQICSALAAARPGAFHLQKLWIL